MTAVMLPDGMDPAPASTRRPRALQRHRLSVPPWWRDVVGALTWASVLVVVALWVSNSGLQHLSGLGTGLVSLGRLSGLLSADLLLIQVLLMARIPLVERAYGQDVLAHRHRLVGFTSVNLLAVHLVLIIAGYAAVDDVNLVAQTWDFVVNYPGMLLATAATALIVMVSWTSIKRARAKLRYESWHLLHLYAYLGVGLSIPHEVWTGADFTHSPIARAYWWSLYAAALGAVLIWRIAVPLWRSRRSRIEVEQVVAEGPGVVSVIMNGHRLDRLGNAGQFLTWRFLDRQGWTRGHPYSLSAVPTRNRMRITVKALGDGSHSLAQLRPESRVLVEGPYGRLHAGVRTRRKVTLIGSGIGITPLRALLEEFEQAPGEVTLIYRASRTEDLVLRGELDALAAARGARVFYVIGPRVSGRSSWLPQSAAHLDDATALRQLVPDIADNDVYLCGAEAWMDAAAAAAAACGVPRQRIHLERFSW
ncbi:MAG: ferredoxin reductase family protein [Kineosporiaceae bacterium]